MQKDWEKYQENRTLIDAFKRQRENINFGISFTMYRKARICAENNARAYCGGYWSVNTKTR
jgi:hypothetical protein